MKIFIAEDNTIIRMTLRMILENHGHEIIGEADNGKSAVDMLLKIRPDLILMDINMPEKDGFSVIEMIHEQYIVPIVIVTGYFKQEFVERANALGVFAYLMKPVDENQIIATIEIAKNRFREFLILKEEVKSSKLALEQRKYIERAKGIIMKNRKLSEAEAMKFLQKKSRDKNKKLVEIAKSIIQAEELLGD